VLDLGEGGSASFCRPGAYCCPAIELFISGQTPKNFYYITKHCFILDSCCSCYFDTIRLDVILCLRYTLPAVLRHQVWKCNTFSNNYRWHVLENLCAGKTYMVDYKLTHHEETCVHLLWCLRSPFYGSPYWSRHVNIYILQVTVISTHNVGVRHFPCSVLKIHLFFPWLLSYANLKHGYLLHFK
jgi:hypothetical protein